MARAVLRLAALLLLVALAGCGDDGGSEEFAGTLRDIAEGKMDVGSIITDAVGLGGVADAFQRLGDPETQCKIVVEPALG